MRKTIIAIMILIASPSFAQIKGNIINVNGNAGKDLNRLFDGDTLTTINGSNTSDCALNIPYESMIVLDSISDITDFWYYTGASVPTDGYMIRFLDKDKNPIGEDIGTPTIYRYYRWTNVPLTRSGVAFIRVTTNDCRVWWEGIAEFRFFGKGIAKAPGILPPKRTVIPEDIGIYAHGINTIPDRINKVVSPGDTILRKVARSIRWYWTFNEFEHYPDGYFGPLATSKTFLGRHSYDHTGILLRSFKRWDIRANMLMTGSSIKTIADTNIAKQNSRWLGMEVDGSMFIERGANPEIDSSWKGAAKKYRDFVTLYGSRKGSADAFGGDTTSGQNLMDIFEYDNEPNRWWALKYYHNPKVYYKSLRAAYLAGKSADPDAKIYAGATPGIDTTFWKAVYMVHYLEHGLEPFPADGFNFNMYLNDAGRQQAGDRALSPERFKIYGYMITLKDFFDRYFGKPVQWTEFGYATDDASHYDVDPIAGKPDRFVQSDWTLRLKAIVQSVRFIPRMFYYSFFEDHSYAFTSMSIFRDSNDWRTVIPHPVAFTTAQEIAIEDGFNWFSDVDQNGDSTGVWVTRKRHKTDTTKELLKIWNGTDNGSTGSVTVDVPGSAVMFRPRYDRFAPDTIPVTVTGGKATILASESMTWLLITKSGTVVPPVDPPVGCVPPANLDDPSLIVYRFKYSSYRLTLYKNGSWIRQRQINGVWTIVPF